MFVSSERTQKDIYLFFIYGYVYNDATRENEFFSEAEAHARKLNVWTDMCALWLESSARSYGDRTRVKAL